MVNTSKNATAVRYLADVIGADRDSYIRSLADAMELYDEYRPLTINDQYKHAMINCLMSQKGEKSDKVITLLSGLKEDYDVLYDINTTNNSDKDVEANLYGRKVGRENKDKSCDEMVRQRYRP